MTPTDKRGRCKSCALPIRWGRLVTSGKGIPLDPEPVQNGNIVVEEGDENSTELMVRFLYGGPHTASGPLYQSHFDTCPGSNDYGQPA